MLRAAAIPRPAVAALRAAGLAVGVWETPDDFRTNWQEGRRWRPTIDDDTRTAGVTAWHKAVDRTLGWVEH